MNIDYTQVLLTILTPLLPILLAVLVAYVRKYTDKAGEFYQAHTTATEQAILSAEAQAAVLAAQQMGAGKLGAEKKQEALNAVQAALDRHGIKVDASIISNYVEAAVYAAFKQPRQLVVPPPLPANVPPAA